MTPEREKYIRFCAEQFHHNSTAIDDVDAELAIDELLAEIDSLRDHVEFLEETYKEAAEIYKRQGLRDSLEYGAKLERTLLRFEGLLDADDPSYADSVIIRCEVTAADIRALEEALSKIRGEK